MIPIADVTICIEPISSGSGPHFDEVHLCRAAYPGQ
jgi:hypothetical protein